MNPSAKGPQAVATEVGRPSPSSARRLGQTIARAFGHLPASQFLDPDPQHREQVFPAYFELAVLDTIAHGAAYAIGTDAAALWMPVGADGLAPESLDTRLAKIDPALAERDLVFHQTLHERHPFERGAHQWLTILGTHPGKQSSGLGSRLLAAHHALLDDDGVGAYLEAASLRARGFYRRHGYVDVGEPIVLPNGSLMFGMWREPQSQ